MSVVRPWMTCAISWSTVSKRSNILSHRAMLIAMVAVSMEFGPSMKVTVPPLHQLDYDETHVVRAGHQEWRHDTVHNAHHQLPEGSCTQALEKLGTVITPFHLATMSSKDIHQIMRQLMLNCVVCLEWETSYAVPGLEPEAGPKSQSLSRPNSSTSYRYPGWRVQIHMDDLTIPQAKRSVRSHGSGMNLHHSVPEFMGKFHSKHV